MTAYLKIAVQHVRPRCIRLLMNTLSITKHHFTKRTSSRIGFLNVTMSSMFFSGSPNDCIWTQLWDVVELKIPAGTCTWRICRNRVMQCLHLCIVQEHGHSGTTGQFSATTYKTSYTTVCFNLCGNTLGKIRLWVWWSRVHKLLAMELITTSPVLPLVDCPHVVLRHNYTWRFMQSALSFCVYDIECVKIDCRSDRFGFFFFNRV